MFASPNNPSALHPAEVVSPMREIQKVWDTGDTMPVDLPAGAEVSRYYDEFQTRTRATRVVRLRWRYGEEVVECEFPAAVLPDHSGVVVYDERHSAEYRGDPPTSVPRHLRVLNADGSLRCRVHRPELDRDSKTGEHWIELPRRFPELGVAFGAPACTGRLDVVLEIDWRDGQVIRQVPAPYLRY